MFWKSFWLGVQGKSFEAAVKSHEQASMPNASLMFKLVHDSLSQLQKICLERKVQNFSKTILRSFKIPLTMLLNIRYINSDNIMAFIGFDLIRQNISRRAKRFDSQISNVSGFAETRSKSDNIHEHSLWIFGGDLEWKLELRADSKIKTNWRQGPPCIAKCRKVGSNRKSARFDPRQRLD